MTSTHVPPTKSISIDGLDQVRVKTRRRLRRFSALKFNFRNVELI